MSVKKAGMAVCAGLDLHTLRNASHAVFSGRAAWWLLLSGLLSLLSLTAQAAVLPLAEVPAGSLGTWLEWLQEEADTPLSLEQARAELVAGRFRSGGRDVLSFGIGARPVWLHLDLLNPDGQAQSRYLLAGATWTDQLDVYHVHEGQLRLHWRTGDENLQIGRAHV